MSAIRFRRAGDRGVLLELPDNDAAVRVAHRLSAACDGLVDIVPGHRTVLVTWANGPAPKEILPLAEAALGDEHTPAPGPQATLAVTYDGPDLHDVARLAQLSPEEVVARHLAPEYVVAFLGFAPGFAYLLGGDGLLAVPRLSEPRERVPAGSVAIAGPYSGVYPRSSPGGWRLIGRSPAPLFDPARTPPALLAAGDRVSFVPA